MVSNIRARQRCDRFSCFRLRRHVAFNLQILQEPRHAKARNPRRNGTTQLRLKTLSQAAAKCVAERIVARVDIEI